MSAPIINIREASVSRPRGDPLMLDKEDKEDEGLDASPLQPEPSSGALERLLNRPDVKRSASFAGQHHHPQGKRGSFSRQGAEDEQSPRTAADKQPSSQAPRVAVGALGEEDNAEKLARSCTLMHWNKREMEEMQQRTGHASPAHGGAPAPDSLSPAARPDAASPMSGASGASAASPQAAPASPQMGEGRKTRKRGHSVMLKAAATERRASTQAPQQKATDKRVDAMLSRGDAQHGKWENRRKSAMQNVKREAEERFLGHAASPPAAAGSAGAGGLPTAGISIGASLTTGAPAAGESAGSSLGGLMTKTHSMRRVSAAVMGAQQIAPGLPAGSPVTATASGALPNLQLAGAEIETGGRAPVERARTDAGGTSPRRERPGGESPRRASHVPFPVGVAGAAVGGGNARMTPAQIMSAKGLPNVLPTSPKEGGQTPRGEPHARGSRDVAAAMGGKQLQLPAAARHRPSATPPA